MLCRGMKGDWGVLSLTFVCVYATFPCHQSQGIDSEPFQFIDHTLKYSYPPDLAKIEADRVIEHGEALAETLIKYY